MLSEFVDQNFFGGVGGQVLTAEGGAEVIELGGIFIGQDKLLGVEAAAATRDRRQWEIESRYADGTTKWERGRGAERIR